MSAQQIRPNICRADIASVNISGSMKERVKMARRLRGKANHGLGIESSNICRQSVRRSMYTDR